MLVHFRVSSLQATPEANNLIPSYEITASILEEVRHLKDASSNSFFIFCCFDEFLIPETDNSHYIHSNNMSGSTHLFHSYFLPAPLNRSLETNVVTLELPICRCSSTLRS
ncbi:hypothetical protein CPB83DRAFT_859890 [Crepidotus variabilis]|uniref:Uncharacterized protein n=1 Tax=Crepidotus variabilis TaxID=179855 RepID=A0A9P6E9X4_9AGAR|nr:hypothetical protein CPB83DRAFT_859890 [Crepidotus variabilis]